MLLLGFSIAAGRVELAGLRVRNVVEDPDGNGLVVDVVISKTAPCTVPVPYGANPATCACGPGRRGWIGLGSATRTGMPSAGSTTLARCSRRR